MTTNDIGFVKMFRTVKSKGFYKKSNYIHLWLHLLLSANFKEKEFLWNNKTIKIKKGQFLTGRKKLSDETGIKEGTVERILDFFENEQQIKQEKTTKFRIITIMQWEKFQAKEKNEQQTDNKLTTNLQQTDTTKKEKKEKEKYIYNKFYDFELEQSNNDENYKQFIDALFWDNNLGVKLSSVLKMETQVNYTQFKKMFTLKENLGIKITDVLEQMENWKDLKKRKTVYKTFITFAKNMKK